MPICLRLGKRAAAMIEFAIVVPVLLTVLFGLSDIALSIFSALQTVNAAQALADLGTQAPALQATDANNIYNAAYMMMNPLPSTSLLLRISNVVSDGNGKAFVSWSCGQTTLPALPALSNYVNTPGGTASSTLLNLSPGTFQGNAYNPANTSFIIVEANYTYTPVAQLVLKSNQVTVTEAIALPRLSTYVGFPWNGSPTQLPAAPTSYKTTNSLTFTANGATITCNFGK